MCVIFVVDKDRPTPEMVSKAFDVNSKGGGVAWREKDVVKWVKGLDEDGMQKFAKKLPIPFLMHFRKDTVGGDSMPMTHPFVVDKNSSIALNGQTNTYVMMHNGTWHPWKEKVLEAAVRSNTPMPGGRWSDSRAMAFVASIYGIGALEVIDERSAVLSPTDIQVFGSIWYRVNGVICSNKLWEDGKVRQTTNPKDTKVSEKVETKSEKAGGTSHQATFCRSDTPVQRKENKSERVEESKKGTQQSRTGIQQTKKIIEGIIDESTVHHSLATEEDRIEAIEWVRSLNQSPFRSPLRPDTVERDCRIDDVRNGVI